jgi:hypothetical protein
MARVFENVSNGQREMVDASACLFAFLFGMIYFAFKGLWRHVAIQGIVIFVSVLALGPPGFMIVMLMWVIYAGMAPSVIAVNFLREGWKEVAEDAPVGAAKMVPDERPCPFCAEPIKRAAIKCRHCHSDVPVMAGEAAPDIPAQAFMPRVQGEKSLSAGYMACFNCKKHIPTNAISCSYCGQRYPA